MFVRMKFIWMKFVRTSSVGTGLGTWILGLQTRTESCFVRGHDVEALQYSNGFNAGTQKGRTASEKTTQPCRSTDRDLDRAQHRTYDFRHNRAHYRRHNDSADRVGKHDRGHHQQ